MRQNLSVLLFGALLSFPQFPSAAIAAEPVGNVEPYNRPKCVNLRNLKAEKPEVFNNCDKPYTIGLSFFDGDKYLSTQIYHVWRKTKRPFKMLGDAVVANWVKDWTNDGGEDGAKFLSFSQVVEAEDQLWTVKNTSPHQHNAFALRIFYNTSPIAQIVQYVLAPGESALIFRVNHDTGRVMIDWSRLDPE